ncbi:MAG: Holliday junction resolvase RuvX [Candidatus Pacebacteria bacterium]|nr:Holliday junction resolvase RuvX [Candidatus Paceibacterota bacterium]
MKYLGIDFGTKRVGIAISDENGTFAFPKTILKNDKQLILNLGTIIQNEKIESIVIGESLNEQGLANKVNQDIKNFIEILNKEFNLPIEKEKEFFSSFEAHGRLGKESMSDRKTKIEKGNDLDSKAAAIILQRYLDKLR